ncbi:type I-E CRISPR-associated protein Cse1/CasA [Desulfovibrio sp. ZJ200]|uniref:type I-E CRISPR-associated protein Cse1/CasA n=1 Tax=Desulfovibrio sp. ZJ200 TaxID=2709792 RepID=UPI0013EC921F|nr:type I-E CRISPR-associated protein Cse1/CasA [Desulfovibrio sp. ZJ200]
MTEKRFNLVDEAWIPVLDMAGKARLVGLGACFAESAKIRDLAVRPHERVALLRLLLCIAHAALDGPKNGADWRVAPQRLPAAARDYLAAWRESFWLFHPQQPFLQIAVLRKEGKKGTEPETALAKLDFARASGNNPLLFDHLGHAGAPAPEQLALDLLTFQNFHTGGLIPQVVWNGHQTSKSASDAPCVCGSMLHAFLRGENLLQTLWANLPLPRILELHYQGRGPDWRGRPIWEAPPQGPADSAAANATGTYLGRLVPLSRAVLLRDRGMFLGEALLYPNCNNEKKPFEAEPSATLVLSRARGKEEQPTLLAFRPDRAVWRDLAAILVKTGAEEQSRARGPLALAALQQGHLPGCWDLVICGLARNQASVLDVRESVYHLSQGFREDQGRKNYENGVRDAEDMCRKLEWAVSTFRGSLDGGWSGRLRHAGARRGDLLARLHGKALLAYWTAVESDLRLLFDLAEARDGGPAGIWRRRLLAHARGAYDLVCGELSDRQQKAFVLGRMRLSPLRPTGESADSAPDSETAEKEEA